VLRTLTTTPRSIARLQLALVHLGGLIACERRHIASVRNSITSDPRIDPRPANLLASPCAAIAKLKRQVTPARVAARREVAITGCLIAVRTLLIIDRRLVTVRSRLVRVLRGHGRGTDR
jgi:hypothetical protein